MEELKQFEEKGTILSWLSSCDHKQIGILYLLTALGFFIVGGVEVLFMRIQLAVPNNHFIGPEAYDQLFTLHGTTMIFLVVVPTLLGLSMYLVPLMIGARDVAFPRLNALGYRLLYSAEFSLHQHLLRKRSRHGMVQLRPLERETIFLNGRCRVSGFGSFAHWDWNRCIRYLNIIVTILTLRAPGMNEASSSLYLDDFGQLIL